MKRFFRQMLAPGVLALALLLIPCQVFAAGNDVKAVQSADSAAGKSSVVTGDVVAGSLTGADDTAAVTPATSDDTAAAQTTIGAAGSDIETVPADDIPIQQAPSSKNSNDAMTALLEFVVLWSVIYIVIKLVRRKLEKDRRIK